jgi:urease accessory protein
VKYRRRNGFSTPTALWAALRSPLPLVRAKQGAFAHEEGSPRVRFPNVDAGECEAVIVNTAGGVAGGDRSDLDVEVGPQARLSVSGAAAEKIYRTHGPDAEISIRLDVKRGAALRWLLQETILFDRARLARRIDVELAEGASVVLAEPLCSAAPPWGTVNEGKLSDRWRVRDGKPCLPRRSILRGHCAASFGKSRGEWRRCDRNLARHSRR